MSNIKKEFKVSWSGSVFTPKLSKEYLEYIKQMSEVEYKQHLLGDWDKARIFPADRKLINE